MATNSSRMDILRLRLQSLYAALLNLPTVGPATDLAGIMQRRLFLQEEINQLEEQLAAEGTTAPHAGFTASEFRGDMPEASIEILDGEHQSGLYGRVFKGRQTALERVVAVKIIRRDWPNAADAIEHAKAIARAAHANIVTVYCVERVRVPGFDEPQPAMIMEWLDGENLGERLGGTQFNEGQVRQMCIGILDGVEHMHANGIAHGDLHPGNVILVGDWTPKIIDIDPNKDISLARLSTISRQAALKSDIEYCQNLVLRVFSHGPFAIATRNRVDMELQQAQSIEDLRTVVERGLAVQSEVEQYVEGGTPASRRFETIRESFESDVVRGKFHGLMPDRAVLAVCFVPEGFHRLDRNVIRHRLPPLLHENRHWEPEIDRHTEISLAEGDSWKTVLDVNPEGVIRAASTFAIRGDAPDKRARLMLGDERARHCIRSTQLQNTLIYSLRLWAAVMCEWQVAPPFRLGVSLLAIQGWDLLLFDRELCNRPQDEPSLSADAVTIPSLDDLAGPQRVFTTLKPVLDDIAWAFGRGEWPLGSFGIN